MTENKSILQSLQIKPVEFLNKKKPVKFEKKEKSKKHIRYKTIGISLIAGFVFALFIYIFIPFSLEEKAKRGQVSSQYELALQNYKQENYEHYTTWMKKASDQGLVRASYHLGVFYKDSKLYQDFKKSQKYLAISANAKHEKSQELLGIMYKDGIGVEQDYKKAMMYLKMSADKGNKASSFHVATFYMLGSGVKQDYKSAYAYALKCSSGEETLLVKLIKSKMK